MKRPAALSSSRARGTCLILLLSGWMVIFIVLGIGELNQTQRKRITQEPLETSFFNGILRGCKAFGVRLILIEPDVLGFLKAQRYSVPLLDRSHTAVAVTDDQVEDLVLSLSHLKNQSSTAWSMSTSTLNCSEGVNLFIRESLPCTLYASKPAHLLLERNGTRVHVVVLFSRGSFYWTAPLSSSLSHLLNGTSYGRGSRAFERFAIEKMLTSVGPVYVPVDIGAVLFQYEQSEFIECNPAIVGNVSEQHASMVPRNTTIRDQLWSKDMLLVKTCVRVSWKTHLAL